MIIAIDGPSGAGKSTVAKLLAKNLGITYLDTGAMYRAVGLKALRTGVSCSDEKAVDEMLKNTEIDVVNDDGVQKVYLDGEEVSGFISEHRVSKAASDISAVPCV
ncbi:MAG: (d)CMP kinase, partial [Clostridia bacterium]|nr:(d)CMP kinase [Clostridia bacterium]